MKFKIFIDFLSSPRHKNAIIERAIVVRFSKQVCELNGSTKPFRKAKGFENRTHRWLSTKIEILVPLSPLQNRRKIEENPYFSSIS